MLAITRALSRETTPAPDALETLEKILLIAPVLLFSMVAHEYAHGYAALKQGDTTAADLGRLTFNPIKHIDPVMTILLPTILILSNSPFLFGGAKPIPVNPANYKHLKRGDIIVSLAGVATNLVIAAVCVPLIVIVGLLGKSIPAFVTPGAILQQMLQFGVMLNLLLVSFNLIPIPPLDGSHVFKYLLPARIAYAYQRLANVGFLILFALLYFGQPVLDAWFAPQRAVQNGAMRMYCSFMLPQPTCQ